MKTIIQLCLKRPYISIIVLVCIVIFGALTVQKLNIDTSERSLIIQDDPELEYYDDTVKTFISDNIEMIYIEDKELFTTEALLKVESLIDELSVIKGVNKAESLFNVTNFKSVDDFLNLDPFIDMVPDDIQEIDIIKQDAINNPIVSSNLVSKDGTVMIVKLYLDDEESEKDKLFDVTVVNNIEEVLAKYRGDFDNLFQTGNPYIKKTLYETIKHDRNLLFPISILILIIMLMITIRSVHGAIFPLITSSLSVFATIGFMSLFKIPLNILTFIIPSLIIVIGSTEDIHILSEFMEGMHHEKDRYKAVIYLSKKVGTALLITALTTFLGFLSISINKIVSLRQFGIAAAFGLFINPVITIIFAPLYLRFFGPKPKEKPGAIIVAVNRFMDVIAGKIVHVILNHRKTVFIVFTFIACFFSIFMFNIKLEYDLIKNFEDSSEVNRNIDRYQEKLSGFNTLFLRVKGDLNEAFIKPFELKEIDIIKSKIENIKGVDQVISISDYIKLMNKGMNLDDPDYYAIPDDEGLISQFFLLMDPVEVEKLISNDYGEINIIIKHRLSSSDDLAELIESIKKVCNIYVTGIGDYRLTGFQILTKKASYSIAMGTIQGLILLSTIIFVIMCLLFLNIKAGLISLVSNTLPVIFTFGMMGIFKIPLNAGTCMVAVVALGLAVDDTIHLMAKYKNDIQQLQDIPAGIEASIKSELLPVFSTSCSLAVLFFVLCISDLTNIKFFGFLSGMAILFAFFCDIFLTPSLLSTTQLITLLDMLTLKVKDEILESKLLTGLELNQVKELLLLGAVREAEPGDYIIREGEMGNTFNIILEGSVDVSISNAVTGDQVHLAKLKEGDIIGEIALFKEVKRTADIVACTKVKYFEMDNKGLQRIEKIKPKITSKLYRNISTVLSDKVVNLNKKYVDEVSSNWL